MKRPDYYIAQPSERGRILAKALTFLIFSAIGAGIFFGACMWARGTVRGIEVTVKESGVAE